LGGRATDEILVPSFLLTCRADEPDEVILVKKALVDHLDMDPSVTIGVLCDQILPPEEAVGEEDLVVRDRLRALVLSFITREARQSIVERDAAQKEGSSVQEMLIQALWAVSLLCVCDVLTVY
jgi:hypothetical protein